MHVWLKSRSFLVALAALFGLACSSLQASGLQLVPERSLAWKDFLGVNAHFLWFEPQAYQQQMSMLQKLGLEWVRVDIHWDRHETSEEVYRLQELDLLMDEISKKKLKSLVYVVGSAGHATSAPRARRRRTSIRRASRKCLASSCTGWQAVIRAWMPGRYGMNQTSLLTGARQKTPRLTVNCC
ncbi:hypothetical protein HGG83_05245 [Thiopseudomonas denitrificans]